MKILSDLLAVILFFLTYTVTKDMIAATAVALIVGVLQAAFTYWKFKKLDTMQWVGLVLIVVFGGATILLKDPRFIMWKPTVLFWIGALVLLFSHLAGKNGLKATMGKELELSGAQRGQTHEQGGQPGEKEVAAAAQQLAADHGCCSACASMRR